VSDCGGRRRCGQATDGGMAVDDLGDYEREGQSEAGRLRTLTLQYLVEGGDGGAAGGEDLFNAVKGYGVVRRSAHAGGKREAVDS